MCVCVYGGVQVIGEAVLSLGPEECDAVRHDTRTYTHAHVHAHTHLHHDGGTGFR
jgi:hypothetical protein